MHHDFFMKYKILFFILSAVVAAFVSGKSQEYTHIHIELPNKFIAEYEKNTSYK